MAARKRHCKRESLSDTKDDKSYKAFADDESFLAEAMHELITRSGVGVENALSGKITSVSLVKAVHDGLVEKWKCPVAEHAVFTKELERKQVAWSKAEGKEKDEAMERKMASCDLGRGQ
jgi:hypothetical protein